MLIKESIILNVFNCVKEKHIKPKDLMLTLKCLVWEPFLTTVEYLALTKLCNFKTAEKFKDNSEKFVSNTITARQLAIEDLT